MKKSIIATAAVLGLVLVAGEASHAKNDWLKECRVDYDDPFANSIIRGSCRGSFCRKTRWSTEGELHPCVTNRDGDNCWVYQHRCSRRGYLQIWPLADAKNYDHFHATYENPYIGDGTNEAAGSPGFACFCNPHDGLGTGYGWRLPHGEDGEFICIDSPCPDWETEKKEYIAAHDRHARIKIWVKDLAKINTDFTNDLEASRSAHVTFTMTRLELPRGGGIDLHTGQPAEPSKVDIIYFDKDWNEKAWDNLPPNTPGYWWITDHKLWEVRAIIISPDEEAGSSVPIGEFKIRV